MDRTTVQRVTARVLPVNPNGEVLLLHGWDPGPVLVRLAVDPEIEVHFRGLEALEVGTIDRAGWWTPDALDEDGSAAGETLTAMMRLAVAAARRG